MPSNEFPSVRRALRASLHEAADPSSRFLHSLERNIRYTDLLNGSIFGGRVEELNGRSVLIRTRDQLAAAAALIELDGRVRRMILLTPDVPPRYLCSMIQKADVDAIITDYEMPDVDELNVDLCVTCNLDLLPTTPLGFDSIETEWVLLTSGTTGIPKLVVHSFGSLTSAIVERTIQETPIVWATFYDIRRYGGLQIFLRAVLAARSMVLSDPKESLESHLLRLGRHSVTHISGTPSHWRRVLWSPEVSSISPKYVRLSGEIADQTILDNLRTAYPQAAIGHAYASTEGGVGFAVNDIREGFPADLLGDQRGGIAMKVIDGSLRIRSAGGAARYLGNENAMPIDENGFLDTGDLVELRGDRYHFVGRKGGIINVGGLKVFPEEVEAVINRHPNVRMSHVWPKKNPIVGYIVAADVVIAEYPEPKDTRAAQLKTEIIELCRTELAEYKVPAVVKFVAALNVADTGKLVRSYA